MRIDAKKTACLIACLVLLFSLASATAFAIPATNTALTTPGEVTLYDYDADGNIPYAYAGGGATGTLEGVTGTIAVNGQVVVNLENAHPIRIAKIYSNNNVTIQGAGTLEVYADYTTNNNGYYAVGIDKKLTVTDATLITAIKQSDTVDDYNCGIRATDLEVDGARVSGIACTGISVLHDITLLNSAVLEGTGLTPDGYAGFSGGVGANSIRVNTGCKIIGKAEIADFSVGVFCFGTIVVDGGTIDATGINYGMWITGGEDYWHNPWYGNLIINSGTVNATGVGYGLNVLTDPGFGGNIFVYSGTLTATATDADAMGIYVCNSFNVCGPGVVEARGGLFGVFAEQSTDDAAAVCVSDGGILNAHAECNAVYVYGTIEVDGSGSRLAGYAKRWDDIGGSAAITAATGVGGTYLSGVSGLNGGTISEIYEGPQVSFNDVTPHIPFENGTSMRDYNNYSWSNGLVPVQSGNAGLLATRSYGANPVSVIGVRQGPAAGEVVVLDGNSRHTVELRAIISATATATAPAAKIPQTGDNGAAIWVASLVLSAATLVALKKKKRTS